MKECKYVLAELVAWVDGELSPEVGQRIKSHLETCNDCRRNYEAQAKLTELLRKERKFVPGETVWPKIRQGISTTTGEKVPKEISYRILRITAAAAAFLLVIGIIAALFMAHYLTVSERLPPSTAAQLSILKKGSLLLVVSPAGTNLSENQPLAENAYLPVDKEIVSTAGTLAHISLYQKFNAAKQDTVGNLTLSGASRLKFIKPTYLNLEEGEVEIEISRPLTDGFIVKTPTALVQTSGTRFSLKVNSRITLLVVTEGKVKFSNNEDMVEVTGGWQSVARASEPLLKPIPRSLIPLAQWDLWNEQEPVNKPQIEISLSKLTDTPGTVVFKVRIINTDDQLWFSPFTSDSTYLLLSITNLRSQVFYTRLNVVKDKEYPPEGLKKDNGLITFPKGTAYELECTADDVFKESGTYTLKAVYGAMAKTSAAPPGRIIWKGLVESLPVIDKVSVIP